MRLPENDSMGKVSLVEAPGARHVVLENAGHLPWLQSPDTFRDELCAFFGC
jgi:pimeloyl-ACP methyl ester carboxylesterase